MIKGRSRLISMVTIIALVISLIPAAAVTAAEKKPKPGKVSVRDRRAYAADEVIVKFKPGTDSVNIRSLKSQAAVRSVKKHSLTGSELVKITNGSSVEDVIGQLKKDPNVLYAQPNYLYYPRAVTVNDPRFGELWGLHNTGQDVESYEGTEDIDMDIPEAWDMTMGDQEIVVAVIDTGVDINHPDLAANIWTNPGETPGDGIDNDGNGYVDDVSGWDFFNDDNTVFDPADDDEHGTHVAGTIAAVANNSTGVAGVAPNVKIMPLKFIGPDDLGGSTSDAISAIEYAAEMGVKVSNNSWGRAVDSLEIDLALKNAINNSGQVFVAAAGNGDEFYNGIDNDVHPDSPSGLDSTNIIAVAAVNNEGGLASFSNYGAISVDIGAPGVDILSLKPVYPNGAGVQIDTGAYRAVHFGFGLEDLSTPVEAVEVMQKALNFLGADTNTPILLVDDDNSEAGTGDSDYLSVYQGALSDYNSVQMVTAGDEVDGPGLAAMSGKTVVWFTGDAFGYDSDTEYALTGTDLQNLQAFLDGGGRMLLIGSDIAYGNESNSLFTQYLDEQVASDYTPSDILVDNSVGSTYTMVVDSFRDSLTPGSTSAIMYSWQSTVSDPEAAYQYMSGTSMATPHVVGAAALVLSVNPALTPAEVNQVLTSTGVTLDSLTGKTVSGNMVNAYNAVSAVDTIPPTPPAFTSPTEAGYVGCAITITGTAEIGCTVTVNAGSTLLGTDTVDGTGTWSIEADLSGIAESSVMISAVATDLIGNTSGSAVVNVTKDSLAPAAPVISTPADSSYVNGTNVSSFTFSGTEAEAGVAIKLYNNGSDLLGSTTSAGGAWTLTVDLSGLSEGSMSITATSTDAAGNVSSASSAITLTKDTVNPTFTVTTVPDPAPAGVVTVTVAAYEALQGTPVVVIDSNTVTMSPAGTANVWEGTFTVTSENGIIPVSVSGIDTAGNNTTNNSAGSFTADTIALDKPYINTPTTGAFGYSKNITISGYAYEPNLGIKIYKDNVLVVTGTTVGTVTGSVYNFSVAANLGSTGTFLISAEAFDAAGNISSGSNTVSYTVYSSGDSDDGGGGGGGGGGGAVPAADAGSIEEQIDPEAPAIVELGDDVTVEIPSGAFAKEITLVLKMIKESDKDHDELVPDENENLVIGSEIIDISAKDGEQPSKGITVTLKYDPGKVTDVKKLSVYYYDEAKGKWEFVGGKVNEADGTISVVLRHFSKYAVMEYDRTFADIAGHWAKADIEIMAARHIADGVGEDNFAPEADITRSEFAALLVRSLGLERLESSGRFHDVASGSWYAGYVEAAYSTGIVAGLSDSRFAPDANITREQMAVMMARAYKFSAARELAAENPVSFADAGQISAWAAQDVDQASSAGIINGMTEDTFAPDKKASRAQGIVMLKRLLEKLEVI